MDIEAKLVLEKFMELGEGPFWDEAEQALYWVDTDLKCVHKYCPYDNKNTVYQFEEKIGAVVKESEDTLVAAMETGFYRIHQNDGTLECIANPEKDKPDNIFNDGKCDCCGRFWAGTVHKNELEGKGTLYMLSPDCNCEARYGNITISNGIAWSEDYKTMYYIDTPTYRVTAFDYDAKTGTISNERTAVKFDSEMGMPDGMTIDRDGNLWVAMWGGWSVLKCNPINGEIIGKVKLPVANVTSCIFGGKNLDILYITTAKAELTEEEKKQQRYAGGLFQADVGTTGFPCNRFGNRL